MQEKLFAMLFENDEVTWQSMIYELVRTEQMDPWDIDVTVLSHRFLDMVGKLKKLDFRVSGKIVLAAAILVRLKSNRLLAEDLGNLNRLIAMSEEPDEEFFEEPSEDYSAAVDRDKFRLIPRTPQPRKRKVSVFDLVEALQQALEVKKRRARLHIPDVQVSVPQNTKDISVIIREIYSQIVDFLRAQQQKKMRFSELVPSGGRNEKVYAFMPLLHLDNQRRIDLGQEKHLSDIDILLLDGAEPI